VQETYRPASKATAEPAVTPLDDDVDDERKRKMRVLITGATGFIGRRVCELLAAEGHELVALSRDPAAAKSKLSRLAAAHPWNPLAGKAPRPAFDGVDAVVHLAGENVAGRWTKKKMQAIRDSREIGTRHLVDSIAATDSRPRVLVSASAIGYYGDRGDEELVEESGPGGDFLAQVCQAWEGEAQKVEDLGVRLVRLRIGIVVGAGGGALEAMLPPFKMGVGGPMGSGHQWWSWVHREDLVAMIQRALENDSMAGVYNATSPQQLRQKEFGKVLGKVLRRPAFLPTPAFALKLLLGGFSTELLSSKRVLPARLQESGFEFRYAELEAALRAALS
jgi:uncharacterized protein (TIGR01777 family)